MPVCEITSGFRSFSTVKLVDSLCDSATSALLGTVVNCILFGILLVQIYLYYCSFPKDYYILKVIVLVQLLLEIIQTTTQAHDVVHHYTIAYTGKLILIDEVGTSWIYVPLMIGLISSVAQGFYCYRVGILTRSKCAVVLISMLSLGQLSASVLVAIRGKNALLFSNLLSHNATLIFIGMWGACSFVCDVVIAATMSYHLKTRDTGFEKTHNIVVRLIRLSIETGCVTALSAGIVEVLVFLPGHPFYYSSMSVVVSKAYSNSMMATLNSRIKPVSNAPASSAPMWNESLEPMTSILSGLRFRGNSEVLLSSLRASEIVLPEDTST